MIGNEITNKAQMKQKCIFHKSRGRIFVKELLKYLYLFVKKYTYTSWLLISSFEIKSRRK